MAGPLLTGTGGSFPSLVGLEFLPEEAGQGGGRNPGGWRALAVAGGEEGLVAQVAVLFWLRRRLGERCAGSWDRESGLHFTQKRPQQALAADKLHLITGPSPLSSYKIDSLTTYLHPTPHFLFFIWQDLCVICSLHFAHLAQQQANPMGAGLLSALFSTLLLDAQRT